MKLSLITFIAVMSLAPGAFAYTDPACDRLMETAGTHYDEIFATSDEITEKFNNNLSNISKTPRPTFCKGLDNTMKNFEYLNNKADVAIDRYENFLKRCEGIKGSTKASISELKQFKKDLVVGKERLQVHKNENCSKSQLAAAEAAIIKEKSLPKICKEINKRIENINSSVDTENASIKILKEISGHRIDKTQADYPVSADQYNLPKAKLCEMVTKAKKLHDESRVVNQLANNEIFSVYNRPGALPEIKDLKACDSNAKEEAMSLSAKQIKVSNGWETIIIALDEGVCSERKPASIKIDKDQVNCLKDADVGPDKTIESNAKIMLDVATKVKTQP